MNHTSCLLTKLFAVIVRFPARSILLLLVNALSGTEISLLLGAFEVVGAAAEVIIANPNGISCTMRANLRTDNSIAIAEQVVLNAC